MYTVYQHIFPNGKRYIGVTRNDVKKRWGFNGNNYRTQYVWRAIQKYGWDNIDHDVFCVCETKEHAEKIERFLVSYFDTTNAEKGYNVLPGGDVAVNDATQEIRYKLGNGQRGRCRTDEEKRKISEGCKRAFNRPESNGHIGKHASEETKAKMRDARQRYLSDENNSKTQSERSRANMQKLWQNEDFRVKALKNLTTKRHKKGEYHLSEEHKQKISQYNKGRYLRDNGTTAIPVVQITKDGEFVARYGCIMSAAEAVSPDNPRAVLSAIGKCCKHMPHYHTSKGYKWMYETEYNDITR